MTRHRSPCEMKESTTCRRAIWRFATGLAAALVVSMVATGHAFEPEARKVPARPASTSPAVPAAAKSTNRNPAFDRAVKRVSAHPIDPALNILEQCKQRFDSVRDYRATYVKEERIGRVLTPKTYMDAKFRARPFSVYMRWIQPEEGKEMIFVEGENDDKIVTHSTGVAKALTGAVKVDPEGPVARKTSRHSIRESGIGSMIDKLITRWDYERQFDETEVSVTDVKINERPCLLIEASHPYPDTGKFMYHTLKVYIDKELMLPVRMESYGYPAEVGSKPGPLLESYTYLKLEINVGLTDLDFSAKNPAYQFTRF